jgi:hypothetical protein
MAFSSAQRTGFGVCLVLTILLVGLHFAGRSKIMQLLEQVMSTIKMMATSG